MEQQNLNDFLGELFKQQPKKKTRKQATSAITKETRKESFEKTDKQPLRMQVLETLGQRSLTAREIAIEMHKDGLLPYPARAVIQPRITELVELGMLETVYTKLDTETGRRVAVYKAVVHEL